jgi:uncharacterized protein
MKNKHLLLLLLPIFLLLFLAGTQRTSAQTQANFVNQANDASVLSAEQIAKLNQTLNAFATSTDKKTGELVKSEFAVDIVKALNGDTIENYAKNLFNTQQIGDRAHNKGILFVIAIEDRKFRIQLGDGWNNTGLNESIIEHNVFTDIVTNMLREENYNGAITQIVINTIAIAGQEISVPSSLSSHVDAYRVFLAKQKQQDKENAQMAQDFSNKLFNTVMLVGMIIFAAITIFYVGRFVYEILSDKRFKKRKSETSSILEVELAFDENLELLEHHDHTIQGIARDIAYKDEPVTIETVTKYVTNKSDRVREDERKEQEKATVESLIRLTGEILNAQRVKQLAEAFINTELESTQENVATFVQNYKNNVSILKEQESAKEFDIPKQALRITTDEPTTVFGKDLLTTHLFLTLLTSSVFLNADTSNYSSNYRNVSSRTSGGSYRSKSHSSNSSSSSSKNSSSSSSWGGFGGGGGFSSGGGASGGW